MSNLTLSACLGDNDANLPFAELLRRLPSTDIIRLGCYLQLTDRACIEREIDFAVEEPLPASRIQGMGSAAKNTVELRFNHA